MAIRSLKASELTGRSIYQEKNRTIYSDIFMKNFGYVITDDKADQYRSYSLRTFESIFAFAILLFISKSNILISAGISLLAYVVISLLFYFKFLKTLPKIENFKKTKKDGYIVETAKEMSSTRLLVITILCAIFSLCIFYYPISNNYDGIFKALMFLIGIFASIFTLMNLSALVYKLIKKV